MVSHGEPAGAAGRRSGPLDAAVQWVLAVIAASTVVVLAACGSTAAGGTGHPAAAVTGHSTGPAAGASAPAGVALCAAAQQLDRVVATLPASHLAQTPPGGVTITDTAQVRALAAALCALPPMPRGVQQCPADFGAVSRLVFASGGREFQPVRIQLSGCRAVAGIGPTRSWSRSPAFGQLLTRTVGGKGKMVPGMHPSSVPTA
jgi:hypothetical protein